MLEQVTTALPTSVEGGDRTRPDSARAAEVCRFVNERYQAFGELRRKAEERSVKFHKHAVRCKVVLIVLGALSATNAGNQLMAPQGKAGTLSIALLGVAMAVAAGLDAAFKPEKVGGELAGLAAECVSTRGLIELTWDKVLLEHARAATSGDGRERALKRAEDLLERLSVKLNEMNARAAALGVQMNHGDRSLPLLPGQSPNPGSRGAGRRAADAGTLARQAV